MAGDFPFAPPEPREVTNTTINTFSPPLPPESSVVQTGAFSGSIERNTVPMFNGFQGEQQTDFNNTEFHNDYMSDDEINNFAPENPHDPEINTDIFDSTFKEFVPQEIEENNFNNHIEYVDTNIESKILKTYNETEVVEPGIFKQQFIEPQVFRKEIIETEVKKSKYAIVDLFWLFNPKYFTNKPMSNEADFITIQHNSDFGNLRLTMYKLNKDSIIDNIVFLENMTKLKSGTIYPSSAMNIVKSPTVNIVCMEQLYKRNIEEDWQINRPFCYVQKGIIDNVDVRCILKEKRSDDYVYYDFNDWQKETFLYACQYAVTTGLQIYNQYQINK